MLLRLSAGHTKSFAVVFGTAVVGILLKLQFNDVVAFLQSFFTALLITWAAIQLPKTKCPPSKSVREY